MATNTNTNVTVPPGFVPVLGPDGIFRGIAPLPPRRRGGMRAPYAGQ